MMVKPPEVAIVCNTFKNIKIVRWKSLIDTHVQTPQARATWASLAMNSLPITVDVSRHHLTHVAANKTQTGLPLMSKTTLLCILWWLLMGSNDSKNSRKLPTLLDVRCCISSHPVACCCV